MKDYITISELEKSEFERILKTAANLKKRYRKGKPHSLLSNKTLFMIFYNKSLRTRNSFEAGMTQLGGHAIFLEPGSIYTPTEIGEEKPAVTERISDVAQVLSRMGNAISIRIFGDKTNWRYGFGNKIVRDFAKYADVPVINMECDMFHPCQAAADMLTLKEKLGNLRDKKLAICWAPHPVPWKPTGVPQSVSIAATLLGMNITVAAPREMMIDKKIIKTAKRNSQENGGSFEITNNFEEAYKNADAVYAKSWTSLQCLPPRTKKPELQKVKKLFNKYRYWMCDEEKMGLAKKDALYMHCMPAARGYEVSEGVIDGKNSVVFDQAENRMHTAKAILVNLLR